MRTMFLGVGLVVALAVAVGVASTARPPVATAGAGKNLKVYPKDTDLAQIKKDMKVITKALGVQCDHCHDLDAMDKDSANKDKARSMMKMTATINAKLKKDGFDAQVACVTCHAGAEKPKK